MFKVADEIPRYLAALQEVMELTSVAHRLELYVDRSDRSTTST